MNSFLLFALGFILVKTLNASPELRSAKAPAIIDEINKKVFEAPHSLVIQYKSLKGMSNDDQNSMDDFFGLVQEYLKGDKDQPAHTPARLLSKFNALQLSKGNRTLLVANKLVISEEQLDKKFILMDGNLDFSKSNFVYGNMEKIGRAFLENLGNLADTVQVIPVAVVPNMGLKQSMELPAFGVIVAAIDEQGGFMGLAAALLNLYH